MKVSLILPVIRPRYIDVLYSWDNPNVEFLIGLEMGRDLPMPPTSLRSEVRIFDTITKDGNIVEIWNYLASKANGDIIQNMEDDFFCATPNWMEIIEKNIPDYKTEPWVYYPDDGIWGNRTKHCVFPGMTRKYYELFGYFFNPEYKALFIDNELFEVADALGRLRYLPEFRGLHKHWILGLAPRDEFNKQIEGEFIEHNGQRVPEKLITSTDKLIFEDLPRRERIINEAKERLMKWQTKQ